MGERKGKTLNALVGKVYEVFSCHLFYSKTRHGPPNCVELNKRQDHKLCVDSDTSRGNYATREIDLYAT